MAHEQRIHPMLAYEDGYVAIDWLVKTFGFVEKTRMEDKGRISHAELELDGSSIMLATPAPGYQSPKRHREHCEAARKWSDTPYIINGIVLEVDDIGAHYERAKGAGATILSPLEDSGLGFWRYRAEDLEGQRWMFTGK